MNDKTDKTDPTTVYDHPNDVYESDKISREEKITILRDWEYTLRQIDLAVEENMTSGPVVDLGAVLKVLNKMGVETHDKGADKI